MGFNIDPAYNEVAERLADLFAKYPNARMRGSWTLIEVAGTHSIVYTAECYRDAEDPHPGIGTAMEEIPGRTPYTKGSEVQNAETSAWGRAIVAVGASTSKKIASADEMRSAQSRQRVGSAPSAPPRLTSPKESNPGRVESAPAQEEPSGAPPPVDVDAASETSGTPGPISKVRVNGLRSRASALVADNVPVADARFARNLPKLDMNCTPEQVDEWERLLGELEAELEKPFNEAITL